MKLSTISVICALCSILLFSGCSTNDALFDVYTVTIANKGTAVITDLELTMVGAAGAISVSTLAIGATTSSKTFSLPITNDETPDSWGDYGGIYNQREEVKEISVQNFEHLFRENMHIEINDASYKTVYP